MPRPARPWFRFYVEAFNDRKLRRLTPTQRWVWVAVLGAARESCVPGELYIAPGVPMEDAELAEYAGVKVQEIRPALAAMEALGMVGANGVVSVTNWSGRQYESDDVTSRVRAHRERSREPDSNVPCNTPETETETETERETPSTRRRTTPIPEAFTVDEAMQAWAVGECPGLDWDRETRKFVDWSKANDARKADWRRTWQGWMRRAHEGVFR